MPTNLIRYGGSRGVEKLNAHKSHSVPWGAGGGGGAVKKLNAHESHEGLYSKEREV